MLRVPGSLHVNKSSGTGLSGYFSFLASFQAKKITQCPFSIPVSVDWDHSFEKNGKLFIIYEGREAFTAWFEGGARFQACAVGPARVVASVGVWL